MTKLDELISNLYNDLRESIRHNISIKLFDAEKPKKVNIALEFGAVGLSSLEMPTITSIFEDNEGIIWLKYEGGNDYIEFDDFTTEDLLDVMKNL